ncbi:nuclear transport factor 2 family protein [Candidatus Enterovibrio altilux]|uniref:Nucleoside-diphosphate-sugar pyrophosphorylase n=1 Tax=Candidatus Enterovibrio altilux TaxID=1927128 RepID=A0A291B7W0_9GAMM|nr:nuclear transport factor 2 family protein [Candidatus Enterovibrio luxaltus]ATF09109.1 Nucleoside-diphosphate-sugar pyrophosphorylase [Candidatus Enterovibrio luxaltus]
MLNILIPLAGKGTFETDKSTPFPKILTDVSGKLLLERAAEPFVNLTIDKKIVVTLPKEESEKYRLNKVLRLLSSDLEICNINGSTQGAACSSLLAIENLDLDAPLIISSFEQVLNIDLQSIIAHFIAEDVDAGVLTFDAIHPKWSYVKFDKSFRVHEAAEKSPISRHAIAGFYFFKSARGFIEAAKDMIRKDEKTNGLFYIAPTLNEIVLKKGVVRAIPINNWDYFHITDAHGLEHYEAVIDDELKNKTKRLHQLTEQYVTAFNTKDIEQISIFFAENFALTDPSKSVKGKQNVLAYIQSIFNSVRSISFKAKNIIVSNNAFSVIEFELIIDGLKLIGTDVIVWNSDGLMIKMNAYLHEKNDNL